MTGENDAMMSLPLPVRLAAGLVATAVEQARELPRLVVEFPVTAVSQALQVSMRVQQRVTELAIKGDRALGALRPVEEAPAWATFDEDLPRNGNTVTELRPQAPRAQTPRTQTPRTPAPRTPAPTTPAPTTPPPAPRTARPIPVQRPEPAADPAAGRTDTGPATLPGYAELSIPQLRAKLRTLTLADLHELLAWEHAHDDRPPFVTMLSNRITTVTAQ